MSWVLLRGKGKPFPYRGTDADSPGACTGRGCCCAACRVGTPYNRAGADSPGIGSCLWRVLRGMSRTQSPTGGDGCGFAGSMSGSWVLLRGVPGRHALQPGRCGFAGDWIMPLAGAAGDVEDAIPYRGGTDADSPGVCPCRGCFCAACRVGTPYIRAGSDSPKGVAVSWASAARNAGDGVPYRVCADSPGVGSCLWRVLRGMSRTQSPTIGRVRFSGRLA